MKRTTTIGILAFVAVLVGGSYNSADADEVADVDAVVVANSDEEGSGDLDRWGLGFSVGFDLLLQGAHASVLTNFEPGKDYTNQKVLDFEPKASGSTYFVNPMFGFNVELATPALFDLPGRPRVYLGAGLRYVQKLPNFATSEGNKPLPTLEEKDYFLFPTFIPPDDSRINLPTVIPDPNVLPAGSGPLIVNQRCSENCRPFFVAGQGIGVQVEFGHFYWETEIGLVFTVPLEDRALLIKPALGFFQQKLDIRGYAHRVFRTGKTCIAGNNPDCDKDPRGEFRFYQNAEIDNSVTETFNSIGPKLTLELEAMRFSRLGQRFGVSLFASAGAFWVIGNSEVAFGASEDVPGRGGGFLPKQDRIQTADYTFGIDPISYQFGVGFKMTWYPR